MKGPTIVLTPALLVCVALPVLFLLAPDGIPCVYAGCAARSGTAMSPTILNVHTCQPNPGSTEKIPPPTNCSYTRSTSYCETYASLDVEIIGTTSCDVVWVKYCGSTGCDPTDGTKALDGPTSQTHIAASHNCNANDDQVVIELRGASSGDCTGCDTCECTSSGGKLVFSGTATCRF
jgi:hypothetical protein